MLYGPTNEEMVTEIFRASRALLQGPAAEPLPHPVEVPRRGAAALRRDALARVPDEGRLFVRPRRGRRAALLQPDVRGLSAHLRAARPDRDPDAWPTPARSAATSATSSSSWPRPARARSSATRTISTSRRRPPTSTSTTWPACRPIVDHWTSLYAATDEKHDAAAFEADAGRGAACRPAASRSATSSTSAPNIRSR